MDFPVKVLPIGQQSNTSYHGREKKEHTFLQSWPILKCIDNVNIFHGKGSIDVEIYSPADWYIGRRKAIFLLGNLWEKRIRNMENWLNFYPMANLTKTKTNFGRGPNLMKWPASKRPRLLIDLAWKLCWRWLRSCESLASAFWWWSKKEKTRAANSGKERIQQVW